MSLTPTPFGINILRYILSCKLDASAVRKGLNRILLPAGLFLRVYQAPL